MRALGLSIILGLLLLAGLAPARAAAPASDWPSLNYDAAGSNNNAAEQTLTRKNVLKLKVKWVAAEPDVSYPIVADGRVFSPVISRKDGKVHIRALDLATGKQVGLYTKDALGGILFKNGTLYFAGHNLEMIDPATGNKLAQIPPSPRLQGGSFVQPVGDDKIVVAGYAGSSLKAPNRVYAVDPSSNSVLWKAPSNSAQGVIANGRVVTRIASGSAFYDEMSGKKLAGASSVYSGWFAGTTLTYTVATLRTKRGTYKPATLYAYDGTGHAVWQQAVGVPMIAADWPHAVSTTMVYVETLKPRHQGIEAIDALSGQVLWYKPVGDVQRMVLANHVLYVLSYRLGLPVRLIFFNADTGSVIGALILSTGISAFSEPNGLMVSNGMVFLRGQGTGGSELLALGL